MSDQSIVTQGNYMSYREGSRVAAFATEADRDIFEAAPDLLEACEVANRFFEQNDDFTDGEYPIPGFILDMRIAIKKARRTPLTKATGREEEHVCDVGDKWCEEGANPARHPDHDSHVGGCNCPLKKETA